MHFADFSNTNFWFPEIFSSYAKHVTKHNIDIVGTDYPRPQYSTRLEMVKRIFQKVKNKVYALSKLNDCLFDTSYLTLAFEVAKNKQ